jgi:hemerythrin-like metal-binding protein
MNVPNTSLLKWMDVFETGIAELDAWHRKLVNDCNHLLRLLAADASWAMIVAKAWDLVAGCVEHFRVEEAIMQRIDFPRRAAHIEEHRLIEEKLRELVARMRTLDGSLLEHRELPASLGPAMIDLMIRHDLDYKSHLLYRQGR